MWRMACPTLKAKNGHQRSIVNITDPAATPHNKRASNYPAGWVYIDYV